MHVLRVAAARWCGMVSDVLPGFYHPSLIGVNTDTNVLYDLIAVKLPEVCNSLTSLHLYLCPHTTVCVLILLRMCPHTATGLEESYEAAAGAGVRLL